MASQYVYHPYPGNGACKRLARHALYQLVQRHLPDQTGQAVTLAGPAAPEVVYLRGLLRRDPRQTWFVDVDQSCVEDARQAWPEAQTFHGSLLAALQTLTLPAISFANLDFMGQYNNHVAACVGLLATRLRAGAILGFTHKRGLERSDNKHTERILRLGTARGGVSYEDRRRLGILAALREDLKRRLTVLDVYGYRHRYSAMENIVVQVH